MPDNPLPWDPEAEAVFGALRRIYNAVALDFIRQRAERYAISRGQIIVLAGDVRQAEGRHLYGEWPGEEEREHA